MTAKMIAAALAIHVATIIGAAMAGLDRGACVDSRDLMCGTPLAGIIERDVSVAGNPLRFAGSLLTAVDLLRSLTWYGYEVLDSSSNIIAIIWTFLMKGAFLVLRIRLAWQTFSVLSSAVGRFFTR